METTQGDRACMVAEACDALRQAFDNGQGAVVMIDTPDSVEYRCLGANARGLAEMLGALARDLAEHNRGLAILSLALIMREIQKGANTNETDILPQL